MSSKREIELIYEILESLCSEVDRIGAEVYEDCMYGSGTLNNLIELEKEIKGRN